jgi:hypothetical protein
MIVFAFESVVSSKHFDTYSVNWTALHLRIDDMAVRLQVFDNTGRDARVRTGQSPYSPGKVTGKWFCCVDQVRIINVCVF